MHPGNKIFRSTADLGPEDIRSLYEGFHAPIAEFDCGQKCAPHNPSGMPFCCRQFPFFSYVTSTYRFIGLAYEWEFEAKCWVISNLSFVTQQYRAESIHAYDRVFATFQEEFDGYAYHSERLRAQFIRQKRRFSLLHRNG